MRHTYSSVAYDVVNVANGGGDGDCDAVDNCPEDANEDQANFDGDDEGDVCDSDDDNDGVADADDSCLTADFNLESDIDGDGCDADEDADDDGDGLGNGIEEEFCSAEVPYGWVLNSDDEDDNCYSNFHDCAGVCDGDAVINT